MEKTLVIMAAGMGSRFWGTKQIVSVGPDGSTILDYSVFDAIRSGFTDIVFVIRKEIEGEFREAIGNRYPSSIRIGYAFQELSDLPPGYAVPDWRTKPWGTGHALYATRNTVRTPFAIINADDFYGQEAFRKMSESLESVSWGEFSTMGYRLKNTLSEHGVVSRGVCVSEDGVFLSKITEHTDIRKTASGIRMEKDGEITSFTGEEFVSMNFWGFSPEIFKSIESGFRAFLEDGGLSEKKEFYLPTIVQSGISSGKFQVRIVPTESPYFGITYREDLEGVRASILERIGRGEYPERLF